MSGDGEDYSDSDIDALVDTMERALNAYDQRKGHNRSNPRSIAVRAQVEWAGELYGPGGVRHVNLGASGGMNLDLSRVREAMKIATTPPLKSYKAKGWEAQWRQLQRVKRGADAMAAAGLRPSRQTLRRWEAGTQKPSKANRERIQDAYERIKNPGGMTPAQARAAAAERLTDALYDAYGSTVRLRDIRTFRFDD
jgi:hypothetical protein